MKPTQEIGKPPPETQTFCGCDVGKYIDRSGADRKADKKLHPEKYKSGKPKKKSEKQLFSQ